MDEIDFKWDDCHKHAEELAEFYTYSELDDFAMNFEAYGRYARTSSLRSVCVPARSFFTLTTPRSAFPQRPFERLLGRRGISEQLTTHYPHHCLVYYAPAWPAPVQMNHVLVVIRRQRRAYSQPVSQLNWLLKCQPP
jgi:hypothetical protein